MKKILNSIDTLNAVGKYSPVMKTESGKLTLNERKEWLKLKYPNSQLKTNHNIRSSQSEDDSCADRVV